jgi:hypothetical protein
MTTRARNTADIVEDVDASLATKLDIVNQQSNRNLLYNGAMQVHQRGTSVTGITGTGYYTADRYATLSVGPQGLYTQSIENDAPTGSGFRKSLKMLCTTADAAPAADDIIRIDQVLEGQDLQRIAKGTSAAQQLTLSFWVKSNVTGTYIASLQDTDNIRAVSASYTINASATWEKKVITFPADTTGAFDNDNAASLRVLWWLGAGSNRTSGTLATSWESTTIANLAVGQTNLAAATNNYWQITGVQLEVGPNATEFEFKSFGQELAECQRYYWRESRNAGGTGETLGGNTGSAITTTVVDANVQFPVAMRAAPSALEHANLAAYGWRLTTVYSTGTWSLEFPTAKGTTLRYTHGTGVFTINDYVSVMSNASGNYYIGVSAEL